VVVDFQHLEVTQSLPKVDLNFMCLLHLAISSLLVQEMDMFNI